MITVYIKTVVPIHDNGIHKTVVPIHDNGIRTNA